MLFTFLLAISFVISQSVLHDKRSSQNEEPVSFFISRDNAQTLGSRGNLALWGAGDMLGEPSGGTATGSHKLQIKKFSAGAIQNSSIKKVKLALVWLQYSTHN